MVFNSSSLSTKKLMFCYPLYLTLLIFFFVFSKCFDLVSPSRLGFNLPNFWLMLLFAVPFLQRFCFVSRNSLICTACSFLNCQTFGESYFLLSIFCRGFVLFQKTVCTVLHVFLWIAKLFGKTYFLLPNFSWGFLFVQKTARSVLHVFTVYTFCSI